MRKMFLRQQLHYEKIFGLTILPMQVALFGLFFSLFQYVTYTKQSDWHCKPTNQPKVVQVPAHYKFTDQFTSLAPE